jgi:hypothetical protein
MVQVHQINKTYIMKTSLMAKIIAFFQRKKSRKERINKYYENWSEYHQEFVG